MRLRITLDPLPVHTETVAFDATRLMRGAARPVGTGVDRIDLAIALDLRDRFGERCRFLVATPIGPMELAGAETAAMFAAMRARWEDADAPIPPRRRLPPRALLRAAMRPMRLAGATYVNASHSGVLAEPSGRRRLAALNPAARLVYLHDIIPTEYPEYQRPESVTRFERFLAAVFDAPTAIAVNSADTALRVAAVAAARGWPMATATVVTPRLIAAHTGKSVALKAGVRPAVQALIETSAPYFIALGTIEPRKNHLLLLNLWRRFAEESRTLKLAIVGRRGWENEMVLDMLDRCPAIRSHVSEFGDLSDDEALALLRGARALLMPSFAEGLGLPLLEAMALGVPAIASDIAVFRELATGDVVLLDPLDGPGWRREILARAA